MPGLHASNSPSGAHRWLNCTPSARLAEKLRDRFGDQSSPFAEEGTAAHSLCELKLQKEKGDINQFSYEEQVKMLKEQHPSYDWKKIEWSTDIYADTVMSHYYASKKTDSAADLMIETQVDASNWAKGCWGTSDAIVVSDTELVVLDYKNGQGVPVSAIENPQARLYGLGAVALLGDLYKFKTVRNVIIQPNLDSISEEVISKDDLIAWGESIREKADLAYRGEGEFAAGDWCRFCPAKALCYHRALKCMEIFQSGMDNPGIIPDEEIPKILEVADTAEAWLKDIKAYAQSQALKGQQWPGWKLVYGRRPPRKWSDEEAVVDQLSRAGYTDEKIYNRKIISVGDAEKLMGKQAFRAILGQFSVQAEGAPTLVPESDKRLSITNPDTAFADLAE